MSLFGAGMRGQLVLWSLRLMLLFFFVGLVTDYLSLAGFTSARIGGDLSDKAFHDLFIVFIAVAQAGGKAITDELSGGKGVDE